MNGYSLWNPTGNLTVFSSLPEGTNPAELGKKLLSLEPGAEQAGFLSFEEEDCDVRLTMAGGEFCGNASLSAAAEFALNNDLSIGSKDIVTLRCSGVKGAFSVEISREGENSFRGTLAMPSPLGFLKDFPHHAVVFPGITHIILEAAESSLDARSVIRQWCRECNAEALGILFYERAQQKLTPYVYVQAMDSLFRENACASGTAAVGYYLACSEGKEVSAVIKQPGGSLMVTADPGGRILLTGSTQLQKRV